ncbi:uncharacterized protein PV07_01136 [Cladophialophora immunda]|uniref:Extracellular membrane protein CFEM domain-containing protein n=1 Tax=Cladophialophora immunda TaxID=569365 RepID=A0A0D2B9S7_9EURO|nr:uncharacterized protein PV07_01136 [Cladophialophora immunda]KIW34357.1 hypothetical protein PV07_01136 [Cladophialophora immunda]OQV04888.1 hypothetical protein CLAIMM_09704 [Cladophialophora immunda]
MPSRTRSAAVVATALSLLSFSSALPKPQATDPAQGDYLAACIAATSSDQTDICNPDSIAAIQYCVVSTAPPGSVAAVIGAMVTYCAEQREPAKYNTSSTAVAWSNSTRTTTSYTTTSSPAPQWIQWSNSSTTTTKPNPTSTPSQWADWSSTTSSTTISPSPQWIQWSNATSTNSTSEWIDWNTASPSVTTSTPAAETWSDWTVSTSDEPVPPQATSSTWEDWSSTTPSVAATEAPSSTWADWTSMPTLPSASSSSTLTKTWTFGATSSVSVGISSSTPDTPMASTFVGAANRLGSPASMFLAAAVALLPVL